jgi:hypothetical protein
VAVSRWLTSANTLRSPIFPLAILAGLGVHTLLRAQHTRDADPTPVAGAPAGGGKSSDPKAARVDAPRRNASRLREGTELRDISGQFQALDGRFEFVSSDGVYRLRMLENLALERAARKVSDSPQGINWKVSGVLTEYEGFNYFLVRRIIVDTAPAAAGK